MDGHRLRSRAARGLVLVAIASAWTVPAASRSAAAPLPAIGIGSASVLEGNAGWRKVRFAVTLSAASSTPVSVQYATAPGTAAAGSDFAAKSGPVTIPAGSTGTYVTIVVYGDTTVEPNESFTVTLSSPVGATIGRTRATGTILDDDPSSGTQVGIGSATVVEGDVGSRKVWLSVTLSATSASDVSVQYQTSPGSAIGGSDFTSTSGTLTIPAGTTTGAVGVNVAGDTVFEHNETFTVTLSSPVGATIARATGIGTITNDDGACGNGDTRPPVYTSVVVFSFENRRWVDVGLGFGTGMPYLHTLGLQCAYFTDWTETNTTQNSLTQYVGQVTGAFQPGTVNDCTPSTTCSTLADNIFRQARRAGKTAVNYVEGATTGCSASGNAAKHIPGLYMWGADDRAYCSAQVRPFSELDPTHLPNFAFVTPTLCNDGHDCDDTTVDNWARAHVQPVLDSADYKAGKVAVFIWYDEDHPVPNLWISPTARSGAQTVSGAGYAGTLKAWEAMLGFPCLANACTAPTLRPAANT